MPLFFEAACGHRLIPIFCRSVWDRGASPRRITDPHLWRIDLDDFHRVLDRFAKPHAASLTFMKEGTRGIVSGGHFSRRCLERIKRYMESEFPQVPLMSSVWEPGWGVGLTCGLSQPSHRFGPRAGPRVLPTQSVSAPANPLWQPFRCCKFAASYTHRQRQSRCFPEWHECLIGVPAAQNGAQRPTPNGSQSLISRQRRRC